MYGKPFCEPIFGTVPGSPSSLRRRGVASIPIEVQRETSNDKSESCSSNATEEDTKGKKTPRVYNVPIHVEPRDPIDKPFYSGHISPPTFNQRSGSHFWDNDPFQNSTFGFDDSRQRASSFGNHFFSNSPDEGVTRTNSFKSGHPYTKTRHRSGDQNLPASSEQQSNFSPNEELPKTSPFARTRHRSGDQNMPSKSPHVTKVFVNKEDPTPQKSPIEETPPSPKKPEQTQHKALAKIKAISKEIKDLREKVQNFSGTSHDKQYRFLDEMLTRCMINLDDVETEGINEIRLARKAAIGKVQEAISALETKVGKNQLDFGAERLSNQGKEKVDGDYHEEKSNEEICVENQESSVTQQEEKMEIAQQDQPENSSEITTCEGLVEKGTQEEFQEKTEVHSLENSTIGKAILDDNSVENKMEVEESLHHSSPTNKSINSEKHSCIEAPLNDADSAPAELSKEGMEHGANAGQEDLVSVQSENDEQSPSLNDSTLNMLDGESLQESSSQATSGNTSIKRAELNIQLDVLPSQEKMDIDDNPGQQSTECDNNSTTL